MSEPDRPRPLPGPPPGPAARPVPGPPAGARQPSTETATDAAPPGEAGEPASRPDALAGLDARPVAEHVDVFEAEHARLERELRTIDQL